MLKKKNLQIPKSVLKKRKYNILKPQEIKDQLFTQSTSSRKEKMNQSYGNRSKIITSKDKEISQQIEVSIEPIW